MKREFLVLEDCSCQSEIQEQLFKDGIITKKLKKHETVFFVTEFTNTIGTFYRVEKNNTFYDIYPKYLKEIV